MFEINVSLNGKHYFATALRSCQSYEKVVELYKDFKILFPEKLGFKINVSRCETRSETIEIKEG